MSATRWWRWGLEIQAAANGFASTGGWCTTATPSSSPDGRSCGKQCLFGSSRNHDLPVCDSLGPVAPSTTVAFDDAPGALKVLMWLQPRAAFPGVCSGSCTNSFCCSLMPIQRPRRAASLRAAQTAISSSSNLSSACISTLIGVLKELPRFSPLSTPVCFFFSSVF